jgi:hypothetical protein
MDWFRDFNGPLDPDLVILGFQSDRVSLAPGFQYSVASGFLEFSDDQPPGSGGGSPPAGGAFAAYGFDRRSRYRDFRISGTINLAGLPPRPSPPGGVGSQPSGDIGMGFVMRGNPFTGDTYAAGLNFEDGRLFLLLLQSRTLYPWNVWSSAESVIDLFPDDYRSRSYFLDVELSSESSSGSPPTMGDPTNFRVRLYDQERGRLLADVDYLDPSPLGDGLVGMFASFRDANYPEIYPPLFASFDDVRVDVVPEPNSAVAAAIGLLVIAGRIAAGRLACRRRPARADGGALPRSVSSG